MQRQGRSPVESSTSVGMLSQKMKMARPRVDSNHSGSTSASVGQPTAVLTDTRLVARCCALLFRRLPMTRCTALTLTLGVAALVMVGTKISTAQNVERHLQVASSASTDDSTDRSG